MVNLDDYAPREKITVDQFESYDLMYWNNVLHLIWGKPHRDGIRFGFYLVPVTDDEDEKGHWEFFYEKGSREGHKHLK